MSDGKTFKCIIQHLTLTIAQWGIHYYFQNNFIKHKCKTEAD